MKHYILNLQGNALAPECQKNDIATYALKKVNWRKQTSLKHSGTAVQNRKEAVRKENYATTANRLTLRYKYVPQMWRRKKRA
jgi:hypothetical protein